MIKQAETNKIQILQAPGEQLNYEQNFTSNHFQSMIIDEDYMYLTQHVDDNNRAKIERGEYVDLAKLLPKDRIVLEEDNRMQLIIKDGKSFWVPASSDSSTITNYTKWHQGFRVYTDIYSRAHPMRSSELIQYSHIIHSISQQFVWDNVYAYDKDFRIHMHRHPERNWATILQQAWSMRLREFLRPHTFATASPSGDFRNKNRSNNDICRKFNRGKCNYRMRCKYEHKCFNCFKFGHSIINCRKLQGNNSGSNGGPNQSNAYHQNNNGPVKEEKKN